MQLLRIKEQVIAKPAMECLMFRACHGRCASRIALAHLRQELVIAQRLPGGWVAHAQQVRRDGRVVVGGRPARAQLGQQPAHHVLEGVQVALAPPHVLRRSASTASANWWAGGACTPIPPSSYCMERTLKEGIG